MEYITLTKDDPEFKSYLWGTFSKTDRALPVQTYHAQTPRERVTFHLVPLQKLKVPYWWQIYLRSSRPELLALTLGPSIAAWLNQREWLAEWNRWPSWFALVGLFFLHTAVFLTNDVQDHLRGFDRFNRRRGSQVIQKGWVTSAQMKRWAILNLALAIGFGLPAFFSAPFELALICTGALFSLAALFVASLARWGLSDLALVFLFGPLLTSGIALASFGATNIRDLILGLAFGLLTVWVMHARQFEDLFRSKPEGFRTFLAYWDFDRARKICLAEGLVIALAQPLIAWTLGVSLSFLALAVLAGIPLFLFMYKLWHAASPLSSSLVKSDRGALRAHAAWTIWWILALGVSWL